MEGWIKIHRKILDNPIICKDSDYLSVWIYLLLNATHKEIPAIFKGQKITLQKGQLITGRKSISNQLKISESKIYRIINEFKSEHQIEQQTSNKNSLITILNWDRYQQNEQQDKQQMNNKRTTTEHKQECKEIYIILFNKYKRQIEEQPNKTVQIISDLKKCSDYELLTLEEQDKLFYDLMNPEKRSE